MTDIVIPYHSGRIFILADLHLDHWRRAESNPLVDSGIEYLLRTDPDALIVAGDLINGPPHNWLMAIDFLAAYIAPDRIYAIPGNHDYYRSSLEAEADMAAYAARKGTHFVQGQTLRCGATRILCTTLWTDYDLLRDRDDGMMVAERIMNDHRQISRETSQSADSFEAMLGPTIDQRVTAQNLRDLHVTQREWLETEMMRAHPAGETGQAVVVTHHGPHPDVAGPVDRLTPAFHSDLTDVLTRHRIDAWFFGHSHRHHRATVEGCDIRNVSIGYPDERPDRPDYLQGACVWESRHGPQ